MISFVIRFVHENKKLTRIVFLVNVTTMRRYMKISLSLIFARCRCHSHITLHIHTFLNLKPGPIFPLLVNKYI